MPNAPLHPAFNPWPFTTNILLPCLLPQGILPPAYDAVCV